MRCLKRIFVLLLLLNIRQFLLALYWKSSLRRMKNNLRNMLLGQWHFFKFLRGNAKKHPMASSYSFAPKTIDTMIKTITLLAVMIFSSSSIFSQSNSQKIFNGEILIFKSKILKEEKRIFINLPKDFKTRSYPTIYLIGSEPNDFKASIFREEFIVVGIENNNPKKYFIAEQSRNDYFKFLKEELIPSIEKEYNSSDVKFITGHSMSGSFVMDVFNRFTNYFSFYIATSPVLQMIDLKMEETSFSKTTYLYFNIGSRENYEQLVNSNNYLFRSLDSLKLKKLNWKYEVLADETHETNEFTGFCRAYNYYKTFSTIPDSLLSQNINSLIEYTKSLEEQLGNDVVVGESVFMPNLLINLNAGNFENVLDGLRYIADSNSDFFKNELKTMFGIVDEIKKSGNYDIAKQGYQLIFDETKSKKAMAKLNELNDK